MSGTFDPNQNSGIESTDDPDLARRFGLTDFNRETGLYTAPRTPDAGQRDGADEHERKHAEAAADSERQQAQQDEADQRAADALADQAAKDKAAAEKPPAKSTGSKAAQGK